MSEKIIEQINKEIEQLKKEHKEVKGTDCEVYSRIVGYFRNVENWNRGKKEEYKDRKMFTYNKDCDLICEDCEEKDLGCSPNMIIKHEKQEAVC